MATVPGTPDNLSLGLPKVLQPTQADMLIAASVVAEKQRLAGEVISLIPSLGQKFMQENQGGTTRTQESMAKAATARTLGRALGTSERVLPMTPGDK